MPERDDKKLGQRKESHDAYEALKTPEWMYMGGQEGNAGELYEGC